MSLSYIYIKQKSYFFLKVILYSYNFGRFLCAPRIHTESVSWFHEVDPDPPIQDRGAGADVFGPLNAEPLEKKCGRVSRARPQSQYIRNYSFKENKDDYFSIKIRIQLSPEHLFQYNQPPLNTHPYNPEIAQNPSTFSMWFCCSLRSWSKMSCWSTGSSLKLAKCFPKYIFSKIKNCIALKVIWHQN